jgi:hypothetical protein
VAAVVMSDWVDPQCLKNVALVRCGAEIFQSSKLLRATAQRQIWEGAISSLTYGLFLIIYVISNVDMDSKKVGQRLKERRQRTCLFFRVSPQAPHHTYDGDTRKREGWKAAGVVQVRNGAESDEEKSVGNDENTAKAKKFMFNSRRSMLFPALLFCLDCHVVPYRCFRLW